MTWDGRERRQTDRTTAAIRRTRWGGITLHPFESFVGVLLVVAGVGSAIQPNPVVPNSPLVLATGIAVAYAAGGTAVLFGLWRTWPSIEGFGLLLFSTGVSAAVLTSVAYAGADMPIGRTIMFAAAIAAATIRISQILRGRQLLQVEPARCDP